MTPPTYHVILPWTNPPLSGNRTRGNVYAQGAKTAKALEEAREAVKAANLPRLTGARIALILRPADRRRRDADNLAPTYKVCQDALVLEDVLPDDSWVSVPSATQAIHPPSSQPAAMWLMIESLGERP